MTAAILLALGGAAFEPEVVVALQGRRDLRIARRCVDAADLLAAAAAGHARVAVVSTSTPHLDADLVAQLRRHGVEPVGLVAIGDLAAEGQLLRMGIRSVLTAEADRLPDRLLAAGQRPLEPPDPDAGGPSSARAPGTGPPGRDPSDLAGGGVDGGRAPAHRAARHARVRGSTPHGREPLETVRSGDAGDDEQGGGLIAVWGPAGAPGRSTIALGVAAEHAAAGRSTLLVDADVYGGAIAQLLALLDERSGVLAAARSARHGRLDPATLAGHTRSVGRGLRVLTGLPRPDRWPELTEATTEGICLAARSLASYVIIDCGFSLETDEELSFDTAAPRRNGATLQVLEAADLVLVVGAADPLGLARLARGVVDLTAAIPGVRLQVVLNRVRSGLGWSRDEVVDTVRRLTGADEIAVLPEDRAACDACLLHGRTLVETAGRSRMRAAMSELAQQTVRLLAARDAAATPAAAGTTPRW